MLLGVVALRAGKQDRVRRGEHARHQRAGRESVPRARAESRLVALALCRLFDRGNNSICPCAVRLQREDADGGILLGGRSVRATGSRGRTARRSADRRRGDADQDHLAHRGRARVHGMRLRIVDHGSAFWRIEVSERCARVDRCPTPANRCRSAGSAALAPSPLTSSPSRHSVRAGRRDA